MDNSIIIKNLPKSIYVAELCDRFRCFGNILSAAIYCDDNKKSIGEAYIEYENNLSALNAVKYRNNQEVHDKHLEVSLSIEHDRFKKVFVKNFNPRWDECDLLKVFEHIGSVETVKISEENGKSNGYGFVLFSNHRTAKRAVESMNGKKIDGRELVVERFRSKSERENLAQNSLEHVEKMLQKSAQRNNLYIKNLPPEFTDDELQELFEKFGDITSAKVAVNGSGVSKEFGFVCFKNEEDAEKARRRMNGYYVKGRRPLEISFKQNGQLRKQYNNLKSKDKDLKIKQYKQRSQSVPKLLPQSLNYTGKSDFF